MKQKLLVGTRNPGKQREIRAILGDVPYGLVFPDDLGLVELPNEAGLEDAGSFEGNAARKAVYFTRLSGLPTAADDSGLEVIALGGKPGVHSRRFAMFTGPADEQDAANNAELLRRLAGLPPDKRRARYRCVVAYVENATAAPRAFEGSCTGAILTAPAGTNGFGYDPLFLSDDLGVSFGEAHPRAKDDVSHRGRAFRAFIEWLEASPL